MRDKTVAGLLALFLGGLGVHRFYLGSIFSGFIYLLFCWTFIPAVIAFFEAILLFVMSTDRFNEKYNGRYVASAYASGVGRVPTPETHVKCPDCRELVLRDARVCKHCGCKLIPQ